jgi:2-acylglycerol O-acyltransferase 2
MSLNSEPSAPEERAAHDLPPKSYADAAEEALESGPHSHANGNGKTDEVKPNGTHVASDEEQTSHEGVGLDGSPKSPTARGHRRVSSRSSRRSSNHMNDTQPPKDMFESHTNGNGNALTTVKPSQELELPPKNRRVDRKRRDSELTAGRQAGAGWSKSK